MASLNIKVACVILLLTIIWAPIFAYVLFAKLNGRKPFPYEFEEEEPDESSQTANPTPWWAYVILALIALIFLPCFILMGLVFGPPIIMANFVLHLGAKIKERFQSKLQSKSKI
jgi:hypothetical protein